MPVGSMPWTSKFICYSYPVVAVVVVVVVVVEEVVSHPSLKCAGYPAR